MHGMIATKGNPMKAATTTFIDGTLAQQFETAHSWRSVRYAQAQEELQPESRSETQAIAGGHAVFAGQGSPLNKAAGLGFDGPVAPGDLDAVEAFYREHGSPPRIELCPLAHTTLTQLLLHRGYRLESFLNVLFRPVPEELLPVTLPPDASIHRAAPHEADAWIRTTAQGFEATDTPSQAALAIQAPTFHSEDGLSFLAMWGSEPAAGGAMVIHEGVTELGGTSTRTAFRGRGLQAALIHARLNAARERGCAWAITLTSPGSPSQRNVERCGFRVAYTKAFMVLESSAP